MPKRVKTIDLTKLSPTCNEISFKINKLDTLHLEIETGEVIKSDTKVELFIMKPDNQLVSETITTISGSTVKVDVKNGALDVAGIAIGRIKLSDSDGVVSTLPFYFAINDSFTNDEAIINSVGAEIFEDLLNRLEIVENSAQVAQIRANKTDIATLKELVGDSSSGLVKAVTDNVSQLDNKTNRVETQRLQNQVNNLVLGAVGDGNNAEVVSSRGDFTLLGNRLDDFDARTDSLINVRNVLPDKCIRTKSWSVMNGDYDIKIGSNFSNAIIAQNGNTNITLFKDINITKITSGDYVFSLKSFNPAHDFNLGITINIVGYPTSVNSNGTVIYTKSDLRVYDITLKKGYQKNEFKFKLNTSGYDHCRFIIELRTKNTTYNLTDIYLGLENAECNDFSYIDSKFSNILNEVNTIKSSIDKLKGKSLYLDGDSITFGAGYAGGYGKLLADKYGSVNTNNAVTGATLATGTTYSDSSPRHYISESVVNSVDKRYDYMILSGGFNDYGNNVPIGTLPNVKFAFTNPVTTDNVIGALETMFRHIIQNYPTTKVFFLITHKVNRCTTETNTIGKTMQDYVDAIKSVCERYSIPVINVWEESRMLTVYDNIANTYTNESDRIHPNQLGYEEFYLPVIEKELGL